MRRPKTAGAVYPEWAPLFRRALGEDALQRSTMHAETPRGFGYIVIAQFIDALDMLPANAIGRHRVFWRFGSSAFAREKRLFDVIGVGGLGEIIKRAGFDRRHCGRDIAIAGQHHDAAVFPNVVNGVDDLQTVAIFKPQIDNGSTITPPYV